ncbi:hypothetical protein ACFYQA_18075 [Streptomyces sp. NPDC005774]|uniref:hypothetical protein n=1 Tax=Streptomyces sp. NPDC005774 TaxID=3364728 RepID=UPI0036787F81
MGRFTWSDLGGQEENPYLQEENPYLCAADDPINNTAPTGLAPSTGENTVVTLGVVSMVTGVGSLGSGSGAGAWRHQSRNR